VLPDVVRDELSAPQAPAEVRAWEDFRARLRAALEAAGQRARTETRKSQAGRKPMDEIVMFKVLVLQALYHLSDDAAEYQIRDRLSFMRFLGLGLEDSVPDAKTIWLYREALNKDETAKALFEAFDAYLKRQGYLAMSGQIVDATIVPVPKNRNTREENEAIKAGRMPPGWAEKPAMLRQKDLDARWTKKNDQSHYGYKNHINIDRRHKLMRRYAVTDAARHDSQELQALLDRSNTASDVWADSAYRSAQIEATLKASGLRSRIHRKAVRGRTLTKREKQTNKTRSEVRARVEHVFGCFVNDMGGKLVRSIGIVRARTKIGLQNLTYNMKRFACLERTRAATA
jgi:transposase, IS5 family